MLSKLFKPRLKLVCFDLDNTLYDFALAEAETEVYLAELISKRFKKPAKNILSKFIEIKKKHLHNDIDPNNYSRALWISELFRDLKIKLNSLDSKEYEGKYWEYLNPRVKIFPETMNVLENLRKKYKIACLSDSDGEKQIKIERINALGLNKYFDYMITTDDTGKNKPSAENYEYLLKISGLKPASA
ncbi:TPA: HAD family hydrolase [Candidatus Woesearchaeota archaeon]|nr:HAD family hydrolase [Candidatus Woesearchaeota archaeon]HIH31404.1 HAD family hydrolase [Candidatus Woesearchaeota archaeon]HIH55169.1 HAD family hydrolase [Candidatus Woesearchaeota archaeon]HIJ01087.1 HAD family hydrolase [Candidatus Woesearchaeota archaeon]HIJ14111.1 HAD family hydrolase [Candidatus Woesearchaeota archaeon]